MKRAGAALHYGPRNMTLSYLWVTISSVKQSHLEIVGMCFLTWQNILSGPLKKNLGLWSICERLLCSLYKLFTYFPIALILNHTFIRCSVLYCALLYKFILHNSLMNFTVIGEKIMKWYWWPKSLYISPAVSHFYWTECEIWAGLGAGWHYWKFRTGPPP